MIPPEEEIAAQQRAFPGLGRMQAINNIRADTIVRQRRAAEAAARMRGR